MADPHKKPLPKFSMPPVIETVLGVEFDRLENWGVPFFGLFWATVRDRFPKYAVKPPLDSQIEGFDKPKPLTGPRLQFLTEPEVRCWFIDTDDRALIQVQNNRFTYNWRKTDTSDEYPHYNDNIRPAFESTWHDFVEFVQAQQLGQISVAQCEVSYINHIEVGQGWNAAEDLPNVFPCWAGKGSGEFLPAPESASIDVSYRMPDNQGRLRVSVKPAVRNQDGREIIQLTLTARGRPSGTGERDVMAWMDLGREWVVRGFTDFTSPSMHMLWKRKG